MRRRGVLSLFVLLSLAGSARAQSYNLSETSLADSCYRVEISMELKGKKTVTQAEKPISSPLKAVAHHDYVERVLTAKDGVAEKTARYYQTAEVTITDGKNEGKMTLRPARAFMVAQRLKDQTVTYCPKGLLTQDEEEVTEHFDTLSLPGLLPGKQINVGETWKVGNGVAQALCDFEALKEHDIACTLKSIKGNMAVVEVVGRSKGISQGADVDLLIQASYQFDLQAHRLVHLDWQESDQRGEGPVSPALAADVKISLTRTIVAVPTELNDFALVPVPTEATPPAAMTRIQHVEAQKRYEFAYSRDWHLVGQKENQVVLRLMDRGEFVAQVTLMPWNKAAAKDLLTLDAFETMMAAAPGWQQEQLIEKNDKIAASYGNLAYRVSASGKLQGTPVVQFFYMVASPEGDQMFVTFTMSPGQAEKLASRDDAIIRSIILPGSQRDGLLQVRGE